eukprot:TRINITY_DN21721_c0_g1_i2.p1 TRINITY_DN21721_c0_g1~~TRINITY_DN21721_c0_g1_i2.p1  ORF type:complete len:332 (+),score=46.19 TRINITY_DN21721_c0_g1_i2:93-1088(+)
MAVATRVSSMDGHRAGLSPSEPAGCVRSCRSDTLASEIDLSELDSELALWSKALLTQSGFTPRPRPPLVVASTAASCAASEAAGSSPAVSAAAVHVVCPSTRTPQSPLPAAPPMNSKAFGRSCDGMLGTSWLVGRLFTRSPAAPQAAQATGGGQVAPAVASSNVLAASKHQPVLAPLRVCACGSVAVRGSCCAMPTEELQRALRHAFLEVLSPVVTADCSLDVQLLDRHPAPDPTASASKDPYQDVASALKTASSQPLGVELPGGPGDQAAFDFEVLLADSHDAAPTMELLRLEASCGGARRMLPCFVEACAASRDEIGRVALKIDAWPVA